MSFGKPKASTTARGYGNAHMKARKQAAAKHSPLDPCVRCGKALGPMGPWLHYDHSDDRSKYLGFAHAACNVSAGAQVGAAARAAQTAKAGRKPRRVSPPVTSRRW